MIDTRDGSQYWTVQIDKQTWMAENLRYRGGATTNIMIGSICKDDACSSGAYYTWAGANDSAAAYNTSEANVNFSGRRQGACPDGWAIPSKADIAALIEYVGESNAGKLKARGQDECNDSRPCTDDYGFSAKFVGYYYLSSSTPTWSSSNYLYFLSTKEVSATTSSKKGKYAIALRMFDTIDQGEVTKASYFSVRCIKDSN
jgi:uncharacterized protein (TIGR02145 family)